ELQQATARGDLDQADRLIEALTRDGQALPTSACKPAADVHLRRHRWTQARQALHNLPSLDISDELKLNLASNLEVMQRSRPQVYQVLAAARQSSRYQLMPTPSGHLTIVHQRQDGALTCMTPGGDPVAAMRHML